LQKPDATRVAGFHAWLKLGYAVRKGEKAIVILAPRLVKETDPATGAETDHKKCIGFFSVPVFDVSQTEPKEGAEPLPLTPPSDPITGDSHAHLVPRLIEFAKSLGYTFEFRDLSDRHEDGWCNFTSQHIVVDNSKPANAQIRTSVHELSHALGVSYREFGRAQAEVIVDSATYCVLDTLGLDVGGQTIPYLAGWGGDDADKYLRMHAALIDNIAKRIEGALTGNPVAEAEQITAEAAEQAEPVA